MRKLKVYGWTAYHLRGIEKKQFNHSFRCVVAAGSKAAVLRLLGVRAASLWELQETSNDQEIRVAMAKPGAVFYKAGGSLSHEPYLELESAPGRV